MHRSHTVLVHVHTVHHILHVHVHLRTHVHQKMKISITVSHVIYKVHNRSCQIIDDMTALHCDDNEQNNRVLL